MSPGFQIGSISFNYYGVILAVAIFAAFLVGKIFAKKEKLPAETVEELALILIIPVIAGARIYHVLHFWNFYSKNPGAILLIWEGGIGIIGAILAGVITIFLYSKWRKLNFLKLADLAAPALALAQSIGRIGNFVNQEGFGLPTSLPWGIYINPAKRPENLANFSQFHPTFFYEALGDFLIFLVLIFSPVKNTGSRFALYLILYSSLRFGLEFLRIDTWQISTGVLVPFGMGIIKVAQVISVVGFLAGLGILLKIFRLKFL